MLVQAVPARAALEEPVADDVHTVDIASPDCTVVVWCFTAAALGDDDTRMVMVEKQCRILTVACCNEAEMGET